MVLALAAAALVAAAMVVQKTRSRNAALAFKSQAFEAAKRGDAEQAVKSIQVYLRKFREDSACVRDLVLQLEKTARSPHDQSRLLGLLEQSLILNPTDAETRRLTARKAVELRKFAAARGHLQLLAAAFPHDADVEQQLGECEQGEEHFEQALGHYAKAVSMNPQLVDAYARQAALLRTRLDQRGKADALMLDLCTANPNSVPAFIARARYDRDAGRTQEAFQDAEKALAIDPNAHEARFVAAQCEFALNHLDAAEIQLLAALKSHPDHLPSIRLLNEVRKRNPKTSDGQEIRALVRRTLKTLEENPRRRADVLDLLIEANELAEARRLLAGPKNDWLPSYVRDFLEARLKMAEEDFAGARDLLERCRSQLAPVPSLARASFLFLGLCQRKLGNPFQAATAFRAALDISPGWPPARLELAAVEIERGQFAEASTILRNLMAEVPEARIAVIRLAMRRLRQEAPESRDWKPIEELLADAPTEQKKSTDWRLVRFEVLIAQGKEKQARDELDAAIKEEPKQTVYHLALADLALRQNQTEQAREILETAERAAGDQVDIRLAQANLAARLPLSRAVAVLSQLSANAQRFPKRDQIHLYAGIYRLASTVDIQFARRTGEKLAELQPRRLDLRFGLLRLALADNDEKAARAQVAQLKELEGEGGAYWRCGDVATRLQFSPNDEKTWIHDARGLLKPAAEGRPDWSLPALLLGELDEREGNLEKAFQNYRAAIELGERSPALVRRTVQWLQSRQRFDEAQDLLRRLAGQLTLDADLARLALPALVGREPPEQILEKARRLVPESSRDYRDHLWLGQLLGAVGRKPADAEKAFRRAAALAPDAGDAWVGLILFLVSSNQKPQAEAALAEAEQKLKLPESAAALAVCLEALGQTAKAEKCLLEAVARKPADTASQRGLAALYLHTGKLNKAGPILENLSRRNSGAASWARRQQAMILIQTGSYARIRDAIPLIERNLNSAEASAEDQRAKAILLALQPSHRAEAIQALESSFRALPATSDEQVLLARLHEIAGNWPAAREHLLTAASGTPAPRHLEHFIDRLLVHNDPASAAPWIDRLEKLDPDSLRTAALRARWLVRLDKGEAAKDLLRRFMLAANDPEQLIAIGRMAEEMGLFDSAEQAYRRYSLRMKPKNGASADLPLARFFALRGRIDEVVKIIETVGDAAPPHAAYSVVSAVVRSPKLSPEQLNRLEIWIKTIQQKSPHAVPLSLAAAEIDEHRLQIDEALAVYDRALAKEPNNIAALNNSAMVLALSNRGGDAIRRVGRAIDLVGPLSPLLDTRALAQLAAGNASAAVADLEEALAQEESAARRFHLALAQKSAGNDQAFADNIQRAKELKLAESSLHPLERGKWREAQ